MWHVYVLQCEDGSFYTGKTQNIERRLEEHKNDIGGHYTKYNKPVSLIYSEMFEDAVAAANRET